MSKSNIKNINSIFIKKEANLIFNKSTYENLLFKLKKSVIWLSSDKLIHSNLILNRKYNNYFFFFQKQKIKSYKNKKKLVYNPINKLNFNVQTEIFFLKKIKII